MCYVILPPTHASDNPLVIVIVIDAITSFGTSSYAKVQKLDEKSQVMIINLAANLMNKDKLGCGKIKCLSYLT